MEPDSGDTNEQTGMPEPRAVVLKNGTPAVVRSIRADGGPRLAAALAELSPQSRVRRFFFDKTAFSEDELFRLTHCDGVNHLAVVLAITDGAGREIEPVGVARCFRKSEPVEMAEVSVTVADEWHGQGVGTALIEELAARARAVGIQKWQAVFLAGNVAIRKLMETAGVKESEESVGGGVVSVIFRLLGNGVGVARKKRRRSQ